MINNEYGGNTIHNMNNVLILRCSGVFRISPRGNFFWTLFTIHNMNNVLILRCSGVFRISPRGNFFLDTNAHTKGTQTMLFYFSI